MSVVRTYSIITVFVLFVALFLGGVAGPVYAQELGESVIFPTLPGDQGSDYGDEDEEQRIALVTSIYNQLPPEDQQRLLEEANQVENYCQGRSMFAQFHDCECVAAKFMEERILNPDLKKDAISVADDVADQCPNIPGAAGYGYTNCMNMYKSRLSVQSEEFCTCYGAAFADFYKDDARSFMPNIRSKMTKALLYCDSKGMASPLNPDR